MRIEFAKMHGLGNDFVIVDGTRRRLPDGLLSPPTVRQIAARKIGIGCDQLLILESGGDDADFFYRIFNADGGAVGQCGNGARCAHAFLVHRGLSDKTVLSLRTTTTRIETRMRDDGGIRAVMQKPQFNGETKIDDYVFQLLNLGNPHAVCLSKAADDKTLVRFAAALNTAAPDGVNVGIGALNKTNETGLSLRVCERGSGMTAACGSGALAAACVAIRDGLSPNPVTVSMPGGTLRCGIDEEGRAWLEGEIAHVFDGAFFWRDGALSAV